MRLLTWNCARGPWPRKRDALAALGADVAIVTEAPRACAEDGLPWFGRADAKNGTTVLLGPEYRFEVAAKPSRQPCVNALRIIGPETFTLVTVWTWPAPNYRQPLLSGIRKYCRLPGPFVVAGDFNGNPVFDKPRGRVRWSSCFDAVERLGVTSAYHAYTSEGYGRESRATHYFLRNAARTFHIDFVFIPTQWTIRNVTVPPFEDYAMSDHRPVIVDVNPSPNSEPETAHANASC